MVGGERAVPLTELQRDILATVNRHRTPESYLAGGAAIHFAPHSLRYSSHLDFFHDSVARVAAAYAADSEVLTAAGFEIETEISQPGFLRAIVRLGSETTRLDWARDSAWRFMPPVQDALGGYVLHNVDLAINKTLALVGRDEPRDFVDIIYLHEQVLPLAALVWATAGKDPGFSPRSLLELLKRRGHVRPEEVARLDLAKPFDVVAAKRVWLDALDAAEAFVRTRPADEAGCLYYSLGRAAFVLPGADDSVGDVVPHFGRPGGVIPRAVP